MAKGDEQAQIGLIVLGATGTIGRLTLDIARRYPDRIRVIGLAGGADADKLAELTAQWQPEAVAIARADRRDGFLAKLDGAWNGVCMDGPGAATQLAAWPGGTVVVNGIVGAAGLLPTLATLKAGRRLALANKESLVLAGELVCNLLEQHQSAEILPVDSEHSAIAQCLAGRTEASIKRIILTASGGPFRTLTSDQLAHVTPQDALKHPTWNMGRRITIDSATMFNKGLELIEARWLFNVPFAKLKVWVHPQSQVHGLVETVEGSLIAQLSTPDMRLPIQLAITHPESWGEAVPPCDLAALGRLDFEEADEVRFPCFTLARLAGERGGVAPTVANAADEVLVASFLRGEIAYGAIAEGLAAAIDQHCPVERPDLDDIFAADAWAREVTGVFISLSGTGSSGGKR
jgi:1-deoxy-D-xylulose-5-phosphate reductoisomerase